LHFALLTGLPLGFYLGKTFARKKTVSTGLGIPAVPALMTTSRKKIPKHWWAV
jgi:hypothetical protein